MNESLDYYLEFTLKATICFGDFSSLQKSKQFCYSLSFLSLKYFSKILTLNNLYGSYSEKNEYHKIFNIDKKILTFISLKPRLDPEVNIIQQLFEILTTGWTNNTDKH